MSTENVKSSGLYYSVIDGTFRRRVDEGTPGATRRDYEKSDGTPAVKWEMVVDSLTGKVEDMGIFDGDFGRTLNITLDANADGVNPKLQFSVENNYGEDLLKKFPNVDFSKEVTFRPFAFTDQSSGREIRGVEVRQGDVKHKNYFWDAEKKEALHGLPTPEGDLNGFTKDDWKIHFMTVRKFLIGYFNEHVQPKVTKSAPAEVTEAEEEEVLPTPF